MATQSVPAAQLPVGVVPSPQAGTSQDTLDLVKKQTVNPLLPQSAVMVPSLQQAQTDEV